MKVADGHVVTIGGLRAFTTYAVQVETTTRHHHLSTISNITTFTTRAAVPPTPRVIGVTGLDPETLAVTFVAEAGLPYRIFWQSSHVVDSVDRPAGRPDVDRPDADRPADGTVAETSASSSASVRVTDRVTGLQGDTKYSVWVRLMSAQDSSVFADSPAVEGLTLPPLPPLHLVNASAHSLTVSWTAPADMSVLRHAVDHLLPGADPTAADGWSTRTLEQTSPSHTFTHRVGGLPPGSSQLFRVRVTYNTTLHTFTWLGDPPFNFSTLDAAPSAPGEVRLQQVGSPEHTWQAWWAPARDHGSPVLVYELQAAPLPTDESSENFTSLYNGSANHWAVSGLDPVGVYVLRARALNDVGWGPWGASNPLHMSHLGAFYPTSPSLPTILAAAVPAALLLLMLMLLLVCGE
ncbi:protein sevenless [Hyalella azteca]|uniref:Protein sevenless n=1 Tax=Hyalella azteca TaxID=294128 RepID=A0A8B7N9Q0_HYAAZ|nr:protein sevenless [Hyalella azteca]